MARPYQRKPPAIGETIALLRARFGADALELVEYWDSDLCAVGIRRPDGTARLVYVSVCDRPPGRYDVTLEDDAGGADAEHHADVGEEELVAIVARHLGLSAAPR